MALIKISALVFLYFVSAVSAVPPPTSHPPQGLLTNGNFEEPPKPKDINNTILQNSNALPGWAISGAVEYISGGPQPGGMYYAVEHGVHAVRLGSEASISQTISAVNGSLYALTFGASRTCAGQDEVLRVSVPSLSGEVPLQTFYSSNGGDTYAWAFTANSTSVTVTFRNPGTQEDSSCGPLLDSVAIKQLLRPKPSLVNLVKNSGFEEGPYILPNSSHGILLPPKRQDSACPLPGWIIESEKAVKFIDSDHFNVPFGKSAIELIAGKDGAIAQVIRTVRDRTYTLAFVVGDAKNGCHGMMMVEAFAAKEAMKAAFESEGKGSSSTYSFQFTAESNRTRLTFFSSFYHTRIRDSGTLCGPVLDQIRVIPADEI